LFRSQVAEPVRERLDLGVGQVAGIGAERDAAAAAFPDPVVQEVVRDVEPFGRLELRPAAGRAGLRIRDRRGWREVRVPLGDWRLGGHGGRPPVWMWARPERGTTVRKIG